MMAFQDHISAHTIKPPESNYRVNFIQKPDSICCCRCLALAVSKIKPVHTYNVLLISIDVAGAVHSVTLQCRKKERSRDEAARIDFCLVCATKRGVPFRVAPAPHSAVLHVCVLRCWISTPPSQPSPRWILRHVVRCTRLGKHHHQKYPQQQPSSFSSKPTDQLPHEHMTSASPPWTAHSTRTRFLN
jgi:hypothetical protein